MDKSVNKTKAGSKDLRIAIVGAGLGGTVAAIFLQRAGYNVRIYEQATAIARIGAGISLGPHIMRIMRALGLEQAMMNVGVVPRERLSREGGAGRVILSMPVDKFPELYGANHLIIHRGDMQEMLTAAVAPGTLELGKRLVDLAETDTEVTLRFADGSQAEADLVIGADGINSVVRELLFGASPPIYSGTVAYRSIFPTALLNGLKVPDHTKWWVGDRHILIYFLTHSRDEIYFVTGVPEPWGSDSFAPMPADMEQLRATFADFHPEVRQVLAASPQATRWPILERDPFRPWSRARVVLIGDACHAMRPHMGQGAAMAIEDAVVLARCIEHFEGHDHPAIFKHYEDLRFDRTTAIHEGSAHNKFLRNSNEDPSWIYGHDVLTQPLVPPSQAADRVAQTA
ncbi:MAG: 6-hydroxynicotinate 3-monooxygenase [Noviherbaspirillum sp.]|nr:6-hydroxynicotinate 3-monooxygenase [Noviherbaspirillum sp.]MDB5793995.1 6-hydroxynicotinate 3-monooxygenase [Noviherbaspirillum sp.]